MAFSKTCKNTGKTILKSLAKYATSIPEDSPPDIFPGVADDVLAEKSNDPWNLENAARNAIGLLVEDEQF